MLISLSGILKAPDTLFVAYHMGDHTHARDST